MDPLNHPCFIHVECFSVKHRAGHWCSVTRLSALFTSGPKTVETVEAVGALNFDQKVTSTGSALWCGQWFLERPVLRRIFIHLEVKQNAAAWAQRLKDSKASHCKTSLETFRMFFLIHFDVCFFLAFSSFLLNWIFWISSEALYSLASEVFVHSWRVTVLQGSAAVQSQVLTKAMLPVALRASCVVLSLCTAYGEQWDRSDAKEADLKASGEDIDIRTAYDSSQCSRRLSDLRCLRSVSACDPRKKTTDWIWLDDSEVFITISTSLKCEIQGFVFRCVRICKPNQREEA